MESSEFAIARAAWSSVIHTEGTKAASIEEAVASSERSALKQSNLQRGVMWFLNVISIFHFKLTGKLVQPGAFTWIQVNGSIHLD